MGNIWFVVKNDFYKINKNGHVYEHVPTYFIIWKCRWVSRDKYKIKLTVVDMSNFRRIRRIAEIVKQEVTFKNE